MLSKVLTCILLACASCVYAASPQSPFQAPLGPILNATVKINPIASPDAIHPHRVMPGSTVMVGAIIKNTGDKESTRGQIFIRYAFPAPLDKEPNSVLFQTETQDLPAILPDHAISLSFTKTHTWPSVFDFLREDWNMRQYQVVAIIDGQERIIGHSSIAVSATYSNSDANNIRAPPQERHVDDK